VRRAGYSGIVFGREPSRSDGGNDIVDWLGRFAGKPERLLRLAITH
jgi:hypothetical protein